MGRETPGEVPERLNGLVSKTSVVQATGGSNPSLSATTHPTVATTISVFAWNKER